MQTEFEYIVVGSGAGGGPLAANLAAAGHRVLLLEAGDASQPGEYPVPAFHPGASEHPDISWEFFVRHYSDEERQQRDSKYDPTNKGVFYPRAGTLGGCTAHHAMILVYPHNQDWDHIADLTGDESWRPRHMRRLFRRLERCHYRRVQKWMQRLLGFNISGHGFRGWLDTTVASPLLLLGDKELLELLKHSAWKAFAQARDPIGRLKRGVKTLLDPNDWRLVKKHAVGIRMAPLNIRNGRRLGARERVQWAQQAFPDNLQVRTGALVTRVLLDDNNRALGVEYLAGVHLYQADPLCDPNREGARVQVMASREVILAGGAFNTPQLLQLSGIGPGELLRAHGIAVRVDLPGVGENLQDRYEVSVVNRMKRPFDLLDGATMVPPGPGEEPDPHYRKWQTRGKGIYTTNGAVMAVIRKSSPDALDPDLFLFGLLTDFRGYYRGYSKRAQAAHDYFSWTILKGHTRNTAGWVRIRSADPREPPEINFRYFEEGNDRDGRDLEAMVDAVEFARSMSAGFGGRIEEEEVPGTGVTTREEIRRFVQDEAWGHHASCSCRIGPPDDPMAVVDSGFRVHGTRNLRVVDASVFPRVPGLFIVSAVYMIAEKASDLILADAKKEE
jgi:choline dehydrogenase